MVRGLETQVVQTYINKRVEARPASLDPATLYVVCRDGVPHHLSMVCPCGCKRELDINLKTLYEPAWKLTEHADKTVSLYPAVRLNTGCQSTIWVNYNNVKLNGEK